MGVKVIVGGDEILLLSIGAKTIDLSDFILA